MIEIKDLHVSYGQSEVIHGVNLEAKAGQIVAVMGRNGMGKTTLFKSLMGVIRSTSGTIKINGVDVTKMPSYQRVKQGIAYVPQGRMIFRASRFGRTCSPGWRARRRASCRRTSSPSFRCWQR